MQYSARIIKLNDYLLEQAANKHQPSSFRHRTSRVPVHLQSVAALANQLLRSGTSIGAKQLLEQREENEACFDFPES